MKNLIIKMKKFYLTIAIVLAFCGVLLLSNYNKTHTANGDVKIVEDTAAFQRVTSNIDIPTVQYVALLGDYIPELGCCASIATFNEYGEFVYVLIGGHDGYKESTLKKVIPKGIAYEQTSAGIWIDVSNWVVDGKRPNVEGRLIRKVPTDCSLIYDGVGAVIYEGIAYAVDATFTGTQNPHVLSRHGRFEQGMSGAPGYVGEYFLGVLSSSYLNNTEKHGAVTKKETKTSSVVVFTSWKQFMPHTCNMQDIENIPNSDLGLEFKKKIN